MFCFDVMYSESPMSYLSFVPFYSYLGYAHSHPSIKGYAFFIALNLTSSSSKVNFFLVELPTYILVLVWQCCDTGKGFLDLF